MGRWMSLLGYQRALDVVCEVRKMSDVIQKLLPRVPRRRPGNHLIQ